MESGVYDRLETLLELWQRYAPVMNLTGAKGKAALLTQVLDGLEAVACVRGALAVTADTRWLDVGSGGGFPGLVVAACLDCRLTLVEPRQKRAAFLELAARSIEARSVVVKRSRFDSSTWDQMVLNGAGSVEGAGYDVASARAVWAPAKWLEYGTNVVRDGGVVVVWVSDIEKAPQENVAAVVDGELGRISAIRVGQVSPKEG